ncbi:MAG: hypothetical protein ACJ8ER_05390 [Allosphingosinicella sp.]
MPTTAQDRVRTGPIAALLTLLSLFLAAGTVSAANTSLQPPAARLATGRHGPAAPALLPANRNASDDEASGGGSDPSLLPPGTAIVVERLWARPAAGASPAERSTLPRPPGSSYRARAPPAS